MKPVKPDEGLLIPCPDLEEEDFFLESDVHESYRTLAFDYYRCKARLDQLINFHREVK